MKTDNYLRWLQFQLHNSHGLRISDMDLCHVIYGDAACDEQRAREMLHTLAEDPDAQARFAERLRARVFKPARRYDVAILAVAVLALFILWVLR